MREAYVTLASSVAVLFGADPTSAKNEMNDMLMLEIEIANVGRWLFQICILHIC